MLAQLVASSAVPKALNASHLLVLLPKGKTVPSDVPHRELLSAVLKRRGIKAGESGGTPVAANAADGSLIAWAMLDFSKANFAVHTQVRKAMQLLLDEQPAGVTIVVQGDESQRSHAAEAAVYAAWVNGAPLRCTRKRPTSASRCKRSRCTVLPTLKVLPHLRRKRQATCCAAR